MAERMITYKLTHLLCEYGLLSTDEAHYAEQESEKTSMPIIAYLVKHQIIDSDIIFEICKNHFKMHPADLSQFDPSLLHDDIIDAATADRFHIIPLYKDENSLHIAVSDPTDDHAAEAIRFHTGLRVYTLLANETELERILQTHCRSNILYSQLKSALARLENHQTNTKDHSDDIVQDEPVVDFLNQLLSDAANKEVSDIHLEFFADHCRIRFRQDGILYETAKLPNVFATRIITRLKILSGMNIAEKRLPQDGRFSFHHHSDIDIRASTCPGLHGENIVLRLLRHAGMQLSLDSLGMTTRQLSDFQDALQRPQGLILVTGPTGSGKTATLYSALQTVNESDKNIMSVEDPVEIALHGITQVNINQRAGLDFAVALRAFLRQDPDIIMIGEIRDLETAAIAVQAAQTGHLVLSTLHTNSAADTIKRLLSMRIHASQLAGALTLIVSQRLVRKLCRHCLPPVDSFANHTGCEYCRQGYHGRTGIFEVVPITLQVTQLLLADAGLSEIEFQLKQESHSSLAVSGMEKVNACITSRAEILRMTGDPCL
ncbi:MAG TPA: ATPase, T2SS/T4P/T4SS family [Gammaproteobacteria bacterium]|jgi:type IV pilus assembly protein PilB|nr:ATPase, T2SS/T4P/T4SS family [Gammaproteobacteria bacterium]